jgi:dUTP pyrophosphatase
MRWAGNADLPLPAYATAGAAGFDLRACLPPGAVTVLEPGARLLFATGFAVALPDGFEMQIRPRSGLALKQGVTVLNSPATIDSDYRGEIGVCLINHGDASVEFRRGDRIAQAVVAPAMQMALIEAESLDATARGTGGFGSTGRG